MRTRQTTTLGMVIIVVAIQAAFINLVVQHQHYFDYFGGIF